jgi:hypothetical protein
MSDTLTNLSPAPGRKLALAFRSLAGQLYLIVAMSGIDKPKMYATPETIVKGRLSLAVFGSKEEARKFHTLMLGTGQSKDLVALWVYFDPNEPLTTEYMDSLCMGLEVLP